MQGPLANFIDPGPQLHDYVALAGETVNCEAGHYVCDVVADQHYGTARLESFDHWEPRLAKPQAGEFVLEARCWCGKRWLARGRNGGGLFLRVGNEWR